MSARMATNKIEAIEELWQTIDKFRRPVFRLYTSHMG